MTGNFRRIQRLAKRRKDITLKEKLLLLLHNTWLKGLALF